MSTGWLFIFAFFLTASIIFFERYLQIENGRLICSNWNISEEYGTFKRLLALLPFFFVSAFQYNVGPDYFSYVDIYMYGSERCEWLYMELNYVLRWFTDNPQIIFVAVSLIILSLVFWIVFNQSPYPILSIFLFWTFKYYFMTFNELRWGIAMAICLYSLQYVFSQQLWKFLLCCFVSYGFHRTSIVFVPVYFVYYFRFSPRITYIVCFLGVIFREQIGNFLRGLMLLTRYSGYIDGRTDAMSQGYWQIAIYAMIILSAEIFCKRDHQTEFYKSMISAALFILLFSEFLPTGGRLARYYDYCMILFLPKIVDQINQKDIKILSYVTIVAVFGLYQYVVFQRSLDQYGGIPSVFQFIWQVM